MGFYINQITLLGKVGRDAELKQAGASVVANFSVATSEGGYKKKDGTDVPKVTHWHRIQCWGNLAELASKIVKKGVTVAVMGKVTYREYTDSQGAKKSVTEIIANDLILCSGGEEKVEQGAQNAPQIETIVPEEVPPLADYDDLPF